MEINENRNSEKMDEYQISTQLQVDKLCRGGQLRVIEVQNNHIYNRILGIYKTYGQNNIKESKSANILDASRKS